MGPRTCVQKNMPALSEQQLIANDASPRRSGCISQAEAYADPALIFARFCYYICLTALK